MQHTIQQLRHLRFTIGQNIHQHRVHKQLTLRKLARLAGIDAFRLDQFELGKNAIHLDELFKIACVLGVDIGQLTG